jgi:hypothetical protein
MSDRQDEHDDADEDNRNSANIRFNWNAPLWDFNGSTYAMSPTPAPLHNINANERDYDDDCIDPGSTGSAWLSHPGYLEAESEDEHDDDGRGDYDDKKRMRCEGGNNNDSFAGHKKKNLRSIPKRPLSAYNFFFQDERSALRQAGGRSSEYTKVGFEDLGKMVGDKWRRLPNAERERFFRLADTDSKRYRKEMEWYKKRGKSQKRLITKEVGSHQDNVYPQHPRLTSAAAPSPEQHPMLSFPPAPPGRYPSFTASYGGITSRPPPSYYGASPPYPPTSGTPSSFPMHPLVPPPYDAYAHDPHSRPTRDDAARIGHFLPPPDIPGITPGPIPPAGMPVRPDQEVLIPDQNGHLQKYRIQYAVMQMSEASAKGYMKQLNRHHQVGAPPRYVSLLVDATLCPFAYVLHLVVCSP